MMRDRELRDAEIPQERKDRNEAYKIMKWALYDGLCFDLDLECSRAEQVYCMPEHRRDYPVRYIRLRRSQQNASNLMWAIVKRWNVVLEKEVTGWPSHWNTPADIMKDIVVAFKKAGFPVEFDGGICRRYRPAERVELLQGFHILYPEYDISLKE